MLNDVNGQNERERKKREEVDEGEEDTVSATWKRNLRKVGRQRERSKGRTGVGLVA